MKEKRQLVQDLTLLSSYYILMCTSYTGIYDSDTYMPRFSPFGFFVISRCLVPIPGLTVVSEYPTCSVRVCVCVWVWTQTHSVLHTHAHQTLSKVAKLDMIQTTLDMIQTTPVSCQSEYDQCCLMVYLQKRSSLLANRPIFSRKRLHCYNCWLSRGHTPYLVRGTAGGFKPRHTFVGWPESSGNHKASWSQGILPSGWFPFRHASAVSRGMNTRTPLKTPLLEFTISWVQQR